MDHIGAESLKQAYAQILIDNNNTERGLQVYNKGIKEPVFEGLAFHPESEPLKDRVNNSISEITIDLAGLNKEFINIGDKYTDLMNNMIVRLAAVDQKISAEEDRIRDINIICGNYNQFDSIIPITDTNSGGGYTYTDKVFSGELTESKKTIDLSVIDVQGNGQEGNSCVLNGQKLRNNRKNLTDNDVLTSWEYARYTSPDKHTNMDVKVNQDNEDARCTITFMAEEPFNSIKIQSGDDIIIEETQTSEDDGLTYHANMREEIHLNSKEHRYDKPDYVYESGIIAFPPTQYMKLRVRSSGTTDEKIIDKDGAVKETISRHRIAIDNVTADGSSYKTAQIKTGNLISAPVRSIAIFANEYVPPYFVEDKYFEYYLTINGIDYEMIPINSNRLGYKIVRFSDYSVGDSYIAHINETIKSAKLKVIIKPTGDGTTPYLSNLKVCLGKAVVS